jgi:hypothetical protein
VRSHFGNRNGRAARTEVSGDRWRKNLRLMLSRRAVVFWLVLAIWTYMVRVVVTVLREDVRASDALLDPYGVGLAAGFVFVGGAIFLLGRNQHR